MFKEFKNFIAKGNVIDLAVAVIMGAAFSPIITSLVNDIIMPPIGLLLGGVDFKDMFFSLSGQAFPTLAAAKAAASPVIAYGTFLNTVVNFLIVAGAIFLIVKNVNKLKQPAAAAAPTTRDCPQCLSAIPINAKRCAHCTFQLQL